jgi:hypothetical protein
MDGEDDAEESKEHAKTKYNKLCQMWKNLRSERDDGELRFQTILLFSM